MASRARLSTFVINTCLILATGVLCTAQMCAPDGQDTDGDGWPDFLDFCPLDPNKKAPGYCGCGNPETNSDGDRAPDCIDRFPNDPNSVYRYGDVDDDGCSSCGY